MHEIENLLRKAQKIKHCLFFYRRAAILRKAMAAALCLPQMNYNDLAPRRNLRRAFFAGRVNWQKEKHRNPAMC